jgi:hypothetical protein
MKLPCTHSATALTEAPVSSVREPRGDCSGRAPGALSTCQQRGARRDGAPVLLSVVGGFRALAVPGPGLGCVCWAVSRTTPIRPLILRKDALDEASMHSSSCGVSRNSLVIQTVRREGATVGLRGGW